MKRICIGVMAHVDAGKTTLLEAMLYRGGATRRLGRVDHQDAFLDTDEQERARGITIFSKQAELALPEADITFLDTPGHVDFSAEMERTLQVLDYALLLSGGLAVLIEFLINVTFGIHKALLWSIYPLAAGVILGGMLLVIAICKPLRKSLHRKFFF